jgi:hypothetical protein
MGRAQLGALALLGTWVACQPDPDPAASGASDAAVMAPADASIVPAPSAGAVPCAVRTQVDQYCGSCHGAQPQFGAPLALASLADFHAIAPGSKQPVHQAALDRVARTGAGVMPPPPQPALPENAKSSLLAWLRAGAPAGEACASGAIRDAGAPGDAGGLPAPPDAGTADSDCELSFELRATDGQGGKFPIPLEDDHYECFYFKAEVGPNALATRLSPLLDDTRALHHWLLFAAPNEAEAPSGTHRRCDGIHPGAYLMAAWLPGTPELVMPPDVGMEMPSGQGAQFILENHYNNIARIQNASDKSGVKVCTTQQPKALRAAIHWLGSERIALEPNQPGAAQATCTPGGQQPIHILGVIPHMHTLGRRATMTILRANGSSEMMHDGPFEFENQAFYPKSLVLNPGDSVRTRCEYMNDTPGRVSLGERTSDEMCYMFTLAYPVGSMNTGGDYLNPLTGQPFVQGPNRCMR